MTNQLRRWPDGMMAIRKEKRRAKKARRKEVTKNSLVENSIIIVELL